MRRNSFEQARRFWALPFTTAALVVLGGCSGGAGRASSPLEGPVTTSSSSTSTTSVPETTTTRPVSVTTPTTTVITTPRPPSGEPRVVASPSSAAPGTRVSLSGDGFTAEHWKAPGVALWLAGGRTDCDFFADATHDVRVSAEGRLTGTFVVPSSGDCRQSSLSGLTVIAGRYRIVYACTACTIGELDVIIESPPAGAVCKDVGFSPNSDNLASDIVAYGLPCEEADAVVRKVGGPLGPVSGAARGEADGFTCVRTTEYEGRGLPSATYECTRGSQRITFTRT